jgi:hypothetical protein
MVLKIAIFYLTLKRRSRKLIWHAAPSPDRIDGSKNCNILLDIKEKIEKIILTWVERFNVHGSRLKSPNSLLTIG